MQPQAFSYTYQCHSETMLTHFEADDSQRMIKRSEHCSPTSGTHVPLDLYLELMLTHSNPFASFRFLGTRSSDLSKLSWS
jgi:hypothetical protein